MSGIRVARFIKTKTHFAKDWKAMLMIRTCVGILIALALQQAVAKEAGQTSYINSGTSNPRSCDSESANQRADRDALQTAEAKDPNAANLQTLRQNYTDSTAQYQACTSSSGSNGGCDSIGQDLRSSYDDFKNACGEAGIVGDCAKQLAACSKLGTSHRTTTSDPSAPFDADAAEDQYSKCPAMAGQDLNKFEDQLKDLDSQIKDDKTKVTDAQQKRDDKQSDDEKKVSDLEDQQGENASKHSDELNDLMLKRDDKEDQIMGQVAGMQQEIDKTNDSIRQLAVQATSGRVKYNDQKAQIRINCNNMAIQQVSKMQADVLGQMKVNQLNRGGFTSLLKNVGITDRAAWQRIANKYYKWCMASAQTVESNNSANENFQALNEQIAVTKQSMLDHINSVQTNIKQLINGQACGQTQTMAANGSSGGETALCRSVRQAYQTMQTKEQAYQTKQQALNNNIYKAQTTGARNWYSQNKAMTDAQNDLDQDQARRQNLYDYLQTKYAYSNGNTDSTALPKALADYIQVKNDANAELACTARASIPNAKSCDLPPCSTAKDFLEASGVSESTINDKLNPPLPDESGKYASLSSAPTRSVASDPPPVPAVQTPPPAPADPNQQAAPESRSGGD